MATHPEGEFDHLEALQGYGEGPVHSGEINDGYGSGKTVSELINDGQAALRAAGVEIEN